jgi:RNA polymerase sigma factor (sigma-70 family)
VGALGSRVYASGARVIVRDVSFFRHGRDSSPGCWGGVKALFVSAIERAALSVGAVALAGYAPGLRRYFSKRVPAGDIDDLVQEVFVRMQSHQAGAPIEHLDRYLFTVAASVLTDQARRRAVRHESVHDSLEESHHPTEGRTPERVLLDREALDVVVAAIADLPARTRDVFVLHRFEEMTCSRIAAQLGMSISAVEKHLMKALKVLHSRLKMD